MKELLTTYRPDGKFIINGTQWRWGNKTLRTKKWENSRQKSFLKSHWLTSAVDHGLGRKKMGYSEEFNEGSLLTVSRETNKRWWSPQGRGAGRLLSQLSDQDGSSYWEPATGRTARGKPWLLAKECSHCQPTGRRGGGGREQHCLQLSVLPLWSLHCCSVAESCLTLCDPMDCSTAGFPGLPCPSSSGACSNSCPLSRWCHPTISPSVIPFSSCPQSFPALGSFLMSQLLASGGQSTGASASASVLPMNIQGWFPLGLTGLISFLSKENS